MIIVKAFIGLSIMAMAATCAESVAPNKSQFAMADFGQDPGDGREIVMRYIRANYKDPYSVRDLVIDKPEKISETDSPLLGGKTRYSYSIKFSCNAKNSYGAYIGVQSTTLQVRDGQVIGNLTGAPTSALRD